MLIRFTRLTNDRHRFEVVRDDRTSEAHELETRSALAHDLAHYAVEVEGGLSHSFYGRLARGMRYAELTTMAPEGPEALQTERVVVVLQNAFKAPDRANPDPQLLLSRLASSFDVMGEQHPGWLTAESLARMLEQFRRILGQWRATPFHETLELKFP
jgi:hypothetical protein